ncbi:MAG: GspH/FimT family pseudopilin [Candidatus Omnitrophota bacterium]
MKQHGFTLLETVIVLAIMTMFFAISVPLFSKFTEKAKLDTTARSIVSTLRLARTYAITNNALYYVFFVTINDEPSYYISSSDEAAPTTPANVIDKIYKLPPGFSFDTVNFDSDRAVYRATGELFENAGETSVIIEDADGNQKTISVEKTTGRARIE